MSTPPSPLFALDAPSFGRWGRVLLSAGFGLALLLVLFLTWKAADLLLFVPPVLLGIAAAWYVFQRPALNLTFVLALFVLISDNLEGIQPIEVLYGLYFSGYLAHWFATRLFFYRDRLLWNTLDQVMAFLLSWIALSIFQSFLFGAEPMAVVSETLALSMLAFYYPVKEACIRYEKGPHIIVGILVWLALFTVVRNAWGYVNIVNDARYIWQLERARIDTNVVFLLIGSLMALTLLLYTSDFWKRIFWACGFLLFFAGLILTQTRGYWVNFALGTFVMLLVIEWKKKRTLVAYGTVFSLVGAGVALLLFDDLFILYIQSLYERLISIRTATSQDLSLVNRFYESAAVWDRIKQNPIIGYGMGVNYHVFDITRETTFVKSFVHNGFLGVWYKFGLIGLVALVYAWGRSVWDGMQIWRRTHARLAWRVLAMSASVLLISILPASTTSNPFFLADTILAFALLMGLVSGLNQRVTLEAAAAPALP